jgi:hypothetical protein
MYLAALLFFGKAKEFWPSPSMIELVVLAGVAVGFSDAAE